MMKKITSFMVLIVTDFFVIFACFFLASIIRSEFLPHFFNKFKTPTFPFSSLLSHFYMALVWIFIFAYEKLYTKRYAFWEEVKVLLKSATLSSIFIMVMIFVARKQLEFSRTIVILAWLLSLFLFPLFRFLTKILMRKINLWKKKLIILGANEAGFSTLRSINANKTMGYEILGFLDSNPKNIGKKFHGVKVIGPISKLENVATTHNSKDVIIAMPDLPRKELNNLLKTCEKISDSMWFIPQTGDLITTGVEIETLGQVLTLNIKKNLEKPWNIFIKNIFEKFLSIILIILLLPVFLFIAIAIKLDSKGPIFYVQKRIGQRNKMFSFFKFRSMYAHSDDKLSEFISSNPEAKKEWKKFKKLKNNDPRVTKAGHFIRKYSLDELPQLFNVVLGNMSLVGPRPYLSKELKGKDSFKNTLARVKPGITGLWQVSGRNEVPFKERVGFDEYYIRNWSLWLDIVILLKSVKVLFSRKGAY